MSKQPTPSFDVPVGELDLVVDRWVPGTATGTPDRSTDPNWRNGDLVLDDQNRAWLLYRDHWYVAEDAIGPSPIRHFVLWTGEKR